MAEQLCIECEVGQVYVRKHGLCSKCYAKWYRKNRLNGSVLNADHKYCKATLRKYKTLGEIAFIKNYFTHKKWTYEPCNFKLNGCSYTPDFYDAERGVFIEVAATRQAFHKNKHKYKSFQRTYPQLTFEIRLPNGTLVDPENPHWVRAVSYTHLTLPTTPYV